MNGIIIHPIEPINISLEITLQALNHLKMISFLNPILMNFKLPMWGLKPKLGVWQNFEEVIMIRSLKNESLKTNQLCKMKEKNKGNIKRKKSAKLQKKRKGKKNAFNEQMN